MRRIFAAALLLILAVGIGGVAQAQEGGADGPGSPCSSVRLAHGMSHQSVELDGLTREYFTYVPASYDASHPVPLVITLHGFAGNARQQAEYSGWNDLADEYGFVAVYPEGTGSPQRWNSGQREIEGIREQARGPLAQLLGGFFETVPVDDVAFINYLINVFDSFHCIDRSRIYVNGLSNGGGMTNRIACEMADVVAAVGTVAGAYTEFPGGCHPARPVPVMAFHGTDDPIVPYDGNDSIHFPAVENWMTGWAERDGCDVAAVTELRVSDSVVGTRYADCADDAEVVFYSIEGGGHTWPGSAPLLPFLLGGTTQDINASATLWAFFEAHPLQ